MRSQTGKAKGWIFDLALSCLPTYISLWTAILMPEKHRKESRRSTQFRRDPFLESPHTKEFPTRPGMLRLICPTSASRASQAIHEKQSAKSAHYKQPIIA